VLEGALFNRCAISRCIFAAFCSGRIRAWNHRLLAGGQGRFCPAGTAGFRAYATLGRKRRVFHV